MEFILSHRFEGGFGWAFERTNKLASAKAFGTASVILKIKDEGIVELLVFFKAFDDTADTLVHIVNHCGIDFHASRLPFLQFDFGPITNRSGNFPLGIDESELLHLFEAGLVSWGITAVVIAIVFSDVSRKGVHRPVSGGVSDVVEERLVAVAFEVGFKVFDGVV